MPPARDSFVGFRLWKRGSHGKYRGLPSALLKLKASHSMHHFSLNNLVIDAHGKCRGEAFVTGYVIYIFICQTTNGTAGKGFVVGSRTKVSTSMRRAAGKLCVNFRGTKPGDSCVLEGRIALFRGREFVERRRHNSRRKADSNNLDSRGANGRRRA